MLNINGKIRRHAVRESHAKVSGMHDGKLYLRYGSLPVYEQKQLVVLYPEIYPHEMVHQIPIITILLCVSCVLCKLYYE